MSSSIDRHRRALVAGRRERQRVGAASAPSARPAARARAARAPSRRRARRRSSAICSSRNSSNASRRRPPSWSPKWAASSAAQRSGSRSSTRSRAGSGSELVADRRPVLVRPAPRSAPTTARPTPGRSPCPPRSATSSPVSACSITTEAAPGRARELARQHQPRARPVAALQPRLVEERDRHRPRLVGHARLDERLHPAPAHRPARDRAHLDDDRRGLVRRSARRSCAPPAGRAGCARAASRCSCSPSRSPAFAAFSPGSLSSASSRDGRG